MWSVRQNIPLAFNRLSKYNDNAMRYKGCTTLVNIKYLPSVEKGIVLY
jgi:hypothetical protein